MDNPNDLISRTAAINWFFRPYSNEESYSNLDVERALKAIPAVDAIPVEWLEDRIYDMKRAPLYRRYTEMLLMEWLQEQKEQEAQDG